VNKAKAGWFEMVDKGIPRHGYESVIKKACTLAMLRPVRSRPVWAKPSAWAMCARRLLQTDSTNFYKSAGKAFTCQSGKNSVCLMPFEMLKHEHYFKPIQNGTLMIDQFRYEIKSGRLGDLLNKVYLTKYMERLLEERNTVIKEVAEGPQWKKFLQ
jgi:hypothetical protein